MYSSFLIFMTTKHLIYTHNELVYLVSTVYTVTAFLPPHVSLHKIIITSCLFINCTNCHMIASTTMNV